MTRFLTPLLLCAALSACGGDAQQDSATHPKLQGGPAITGAAATAGAATVKQFPGLREDYTLTHLGATTTVKLKSGAQPAVAAPGDATLRFDDSSIVFGTGSAAARILRLYQAAFDRAPDTAGLSYWVGLLEQGATLDTIAAGFATSPEYLALYGTSPSALVTVVNLYKNALRREGDTEGILYWSAVLTEGRKSVPQVLVSFSESQENQAGTQSAMNQGLALFESGVSYIPVARPGLARQVLTGIDVQLDGSASSAAKPLSYRWTLSSKPGGSLSVLAAADSATPTFRPDLAGVYVLDLVVDDGAAFSKAASLQLTAKTIPEVWKAAPDSVPASGNYVYLQGAEGDPIVGNRSYLYRQSDLSFNFLGKDSFMFASLRRRQSEWGLQNWTGDFQLPGRPARLEPGYYGDLSRMPTGGNDSGGFHWYNDVRKCATLTGWFVIDRVRYSGDALAAIDLRFEQRCNDAPAVLHGQIHWDAADTSNVPLPVLPMPAGLWSPSASAPAGNYVYLESAAGDEVGLGKTYLHTEAAGARVATVGNRFTVLVNDTASGDKWNGTFFAMSALSNLQAGYYGDLSRYPYHELAKGGIDWSAEGRGCTNSADAGWFAIDSVTYAFGKVKTLDVRFENRCWAGAPPLRGKIHWVF